MENRIPAIIWRRTDPVTGGKIFAPGTRGAGAARGGEGIEGRRFFHLTEKGGRYERSALEILRHAAGKGIILSLNLLPAGMRERMSGEAQLSLLYALSNHTERHYRRARIPKKSGGSRRLLAPDGLLKSVQREYPASLSGRTQRICPRLRLPAGALAHRQCRASCGRGKGQNSSEAGHPDFLTASFFRGCMGRRFRRACFRRRPRGF